MEDESGSYWADTLPDYIGDSGGAYQGTNLDPFIVAEDKLDPNEGTGDVKGFDQDFWDFWGGSNDDPLNGDASGGFWNSLLNSLGNTVKSGVEKKTAAASGSSGGGSSGGSSSNQAKPNTSQTVTTINNFLTSPIGIVAVVGAVILGVVYIAKKK
jgi:hypothetical protein